ncbi:hypothetical protein [Natrinema sp. HArc-T2]|uniref:hypothetical protein n=1 Tax=Natrinema sp. HArc-T2 TaxID=3242701 RepID=UPI00359D606D
MRSKIDIILSDGREVEDSEIRILEQEIDSSLYTTGTKKFYKCSHPSDPDYEYIPDRSCEGTVDVDAERLVCEKCSRIITDPQGKEEFQSEILYLNKRGVRDKIRKRVKEEFDTTATTVSRSYFDRKFSYVLDVEDPDINIFILSSSISAEVAEWCKVYNEKPVFALIGDARSVSNKLSDLRIPHFGFSEVISDDFVSIISEADRGLLSDRELRASLSHRLCSDREVLEQMEYDDFERSVQNLLAGTIATSSLLGSSEAGSGVPDGLLTLDYSSPPPLFMWDAKFVDYTSGERTKTTLKSEYDKILRHETSIESVPSIDNNFDGVEGIILFTPGIKESNVKRLAEFIDENRFLQNSSGNSTICYFKFDALLELFNLYTKNESNVQRKERGFRATLHRYMTSSSKHDSDTDIIDNTENCLEMDIDDIHNVFSRVASLGIEQKEIPDEEYLSFLEMMST